MPAPVPNPEDLPRLPVITVTGTRGGTVGPAFGSFFDAPSGAGFAAGGFIAPALTPAIEEIIATASRRPPPPPPSLNLMSAARALGWIGLGIGAIYSLSRAAEKAQEEQDEAIAKHNLDLELQRMAEEMGVNLTVTASRIRALAPPQYIPQRISPLIEPGFDPGILIPFTPTVLPATEPAVAPEVEVAPVTAPQIPTFRPSVLPELLPGIAPQELPIPRTLPRRAPQRRPSRRMRPETQPQTQPATAPAPAVSPMTAPAASPFAQVSPATSLASSFATASEAATRSLTGAQAEALSSALAASTSSVDDQVKRCKEEIDEPRTQCYKKLIREHAFPRFDEEYEWTEIDCFTQREI